ncbi:MAG: D-tyrosyl-tRNA(Tyr) deacylase [Acetatifactor sp.]|nr:D-tyrosyl-tRNA(Tyr) deacylase [Acetatifactor sp.]
MRFVIQRVTEASVTVDGQIIGSIGKGFLVLIGVSQTDTQATADKMIRKLLGLRIFEDQNGKTNLSLEDVDGSLLLVSQFTLYADCRKGNRPSFINAGSPDLADNLYQYIINECQRQLSPVSGKVQHGIFGADMKVSLLNDGPFTIILDSNDLA